MKKTESSSSLYLIRNSGFEWHSNEFCHAKGYIYDALGTLYMGNTLLNFFNEIQTLEQFKSKLTLANGQFSVIILKEEFSLLATDVIRSLPLFYMKGNSGWMISDDSFTLLEKVGNPDLNNLAEKEFSATGYVTGNETLISGIRQVQAGEIVELNADRSGSFYYSYRISSPISASFHTLKAEGKRAIDNAFGRLVQSLDGRTACVPLSGGFDSRLIAVMLKELGYEKVVCFTYGRAGNSEVQISERVAKRLGYPWHFIEYSDELIRDYVSDHEFRRYYQYASNHVSMFFLQEYFAVQYLKKNGMIPADALFIPGHSGDFLGGSQFAKHHFSAAEEPSDVLVNRILNVKYHYRKFTGKERNAMRSRILKSLTEKETGEKSLAWSVHEDWDFKEKLAKFNANSVSTFTFFGYEYRLPYWDLELIEFFKKLPADVKLNKRLYDAILSEEYFSKWQLNMEEELQPDMKYYARARLKRRIKSLVPGFITRLLVKKKDWLCYYEITSQLRKDLISKGKRPLKYGNRYNKMIINWYLEAVKEQIKG